MISLDRHELMEVGQIYVLANTPYSLYWALLDTTVVSRMINECTPSELEAFYDHITSRARRSEISLGLAYSVLIAILTCDKPHKAVDASRLRWGLAIEELIHKSGRATQSQVILLSGLQPTVQVQEHSRGGSGLIIPSTANIPPRRRV